MIHLNPSTESTQGQTPAGLSATVALIGLLFGIGLGAQAPAPTARAAVQPRLRALPDNNLGYPIRIRINSQGGGGSGFFVNADNEIFLVTAGHVLVDRTTGTIRPQVEIEAPSSNPAITEMTRLGMDLAVLNTGGHVKTDAARDVAVVRFAANREDGRLAIITPGVRVIKEVVEGAMVTAPLSRLRPFSDVLISNPVYVFGYPTSIGIPLGIPGAPPPQIDFDRPLLRQGIVAGLNVAKQTIILDATIHPGNSGGPVMQRTATGSPIVGLVTEFVPFYQVQPGAKSVVVENSGYAVATAMDPVIAFIKAIQERRILLPTAAGRSEPLGK